MQDREVTLADMLNIREQRAWRQQQLRSKYHCPVICFTMNIAGPVKNSDLIREGFDIGCQMIQNSLRDNQMPILFSAEEKNWYGCEGYFVADDSGEKIKKLMMEIEDSGRIGRLFDIDVIDQKGIKIERGMMNLTSRKCLICGADAKVCGSRRKHSVDELTKVTNEILKETIWDRNSDLIAELAVRSLLYEVCTTPKPGLVDRDNNGSHADMDIFTFMSSSASLWPYFKKCAKVGMESISMEDRELFHKLKLAGCDAERAMYRVTEGVNTHKGIIYSLGVMCGAAGRIGIEKCSDTELLFEECKKITEGTTEEYFRNLTTDKAKTVGEKLFFSYGIKGIRWQVEQGFPAVREIGIKTLMAALEDGMSLNDAGANCLMALMAAETDTNLVSRGGRELQLEVVEKIRKVQRDIGYFNKELLVDWNEEFVEKNLSPGGTADLLAITYFVYFLMEMAEGKAKDGLQNI